MSDHTERLREVLETLQPLLYAQLESGRNLDKKAWDILTFTTGGITLGISLQSALIEQRSLGLFVFSLGILFVFYIWLIWLVAKIVKPHKRPYVPGNATSLSIIMEKYIKVSEDLFLLQMIADYTGDDTEGKKLVGAIQEAQETNNNKSYYLNLAFIATGIITICLILTAVLRI